MYFNAVFETEKNIYVIEQLSQKLILVEKDSGRVRILVGLPWECNTIKNGILRVGHLLYIYSLSCNYFFKYDIRSEKIEKIEFADLEYDNEKLFYSNFLIYKDRIVLLPFLGNSIKVYDHQGKLQEKIFFHDDKLCKKNAADRIIRSYSAIMVENSIIFSLKYDKENYLCRYDLQKKENRIIYQAKETPVKGVYFFKDRIVFRRIFPTKTEIVFLNLKNNLEDVIEIASTSLFDSDIYAEDGRLYTFVPEQPIVGEKSVYLLKKKVYIGNGILFDPQTDELLVIRNRQERIYSLKKVLNKIRNEKYTKIYRTMLCCNVMTEGEYWIQRFLNEIQSENKDFEKSLNRDMVGSNIWKMLA